MDLKSTVLLRLHSLVKCPLVAFLGITVEELSPTTCKVKLPFRWRVKNPMGSAFLGALTSGADVAGSLAAYHVVRNLGASVSILFKEMKATFLKKAVTDVIFVCGDVEKINSAGKETISTGNPVEVAVFVDAFARGNEGKEPLARFELLLSMKRRERTR